MRGIRNADYLTSMIGKTHLVTASYSARQSARSRPRTIVETEVSQWR